MYSDVIYAINRCRQLGWTEEYLCNFISKHQGQSEDTWYQTCLSKEVIHRLP